MQFKLAIRNILKNKKISFYRVSGLILAFLTIMLISSWVFFQFSYDRYNSKADRIYRFTVEQIHKKMNFTWNFARTWQLWRRDLPGYFPQIERMTELVPLSPTTVKIGDNKLTSRKAFASDSSFFKVFDVKFIEGDPVHAIDDKNTVIISQTFANKYFHGENPLNKTMKIGGYHDNFTTLTITGVFKDIPKNSHFHLDFLVHHTDHSNDKGNQWAYTYILLKKGCSIHDIEANIPGFIKTYVPENQQKSAHLHFTPLADIHLRSHIEREIEENGDIRQVKLFILIALGIFLMVLINYINLGTVAYSRRFINFKINKFLGAKPRHIFYSLLIESLILTSIALFIAIILYTPFKIVLNYIGINYALSLTSWLFPKLALTLFLAYLLFVASGYLPVAIVSFRQFKQLTNKNNLSSLLSTRHRLLNNTLLIFQFSISIIVIICSLILKSQNNYLLSKQLGGINNNIISISRVFTGNDNESTVFCNELKKFPEIADVTCSFDNPTYYIKDMRIVYCNNIPPDKKGQAITICPEDYNFFSFFNIPLVAGSYLIPYQQGQKYINYILNEKAVKRLGFASPKDAIGSDFRLSSYNNDIKYGGKIVGVVKDFHFSSLYHPMQATAYFQMPKYYGVYLIKLRSGMSQSLLSKLKKTWNKEFPDYPMDYQYLSDVYDHIYKKDLVQGKLFNLFAIISIIISSIGLIGISNIVLLQRTKEIGIRKANGAKISEILVLINKNHIQQITVAIMLAWPIAWFIMNKWLQNYAYRISIGWWIFAIAGILALGIALFTVSFQSWKTATRNPVDALRYE